MFSTDFIFRQQENLVDNQKCQAGFRPLCNKILFPLFLPMFTAAQKVGRLENTIMSMQPIYYTNSLVNADLFYANFTSTTFQNEP